MTKICLLLAVLFQTSVAFAQQYWINDTLVRELRYPLTEQDTQPVFYYFNDEWIAGAHPDMVPVDSIRKVEIKNDEYGNRAVFLTVSPETIATINQQLEQLFINFDPICEFPGGNGKLKEWIDANIRIPDGYKGSERVHVRIIINPEGSIINATIIRPSKNEAANEEALRLVNALPKFRVQYCTPRKCNLNYYISIAFKEPGAIFIRGDESSFINQFPVIKDNIKQLYETIVFGTVKDSNFKIADICTADFLHRLEKANDYDSPGYATWLLRSGNQDGDDTPSKVISIVPGEGNTVIVHWSDMGHQCSTTFTMTESDGEWKINDATVPEGYCPL